VALRNGKTITFKPHGLSDTLDGTNTFPGAMAQLANLIPAPSTKNVFVPRPAAVQLTNFSPFNTPKQPVLICPVGSLVFGMLPTARFAGNDEPFVYNLLTNSFITIAGVTAANTPTTQASTGDWTPPSAAVVGGRVIMTHPGFAGGASPYYFGGIDVSSFLDNTHTGNTHGSKTVDTLSADALTLGWQVGMTIQSSAGDIPAGTTIVSIASGGLSVTLSNAATGSNAGVTLTVAGGTPTSPLWFAGNVNLNPLVAVPNWVLEFNGRAWFAVNYNMNGVTIPAAVYTDSGNPTNATNAGQAISINNGIPITTLQPLALTSPLTGGVTQAFYIIQGTANILQVTGDATSNNLAVQNLNLNVGSSASNGFATCADGLLMMAPDGIRLVDLTGRINPVLGSQGNGVAVPFQNALYPTRAAGAFNMGVYRIAIEVATSTGTAFNEYWFDMDKKVTTGPHSFTSALIEPLNYLNTNSFLVVPNGGGASLWRSDILPSSGSIYEENGTALTFSYLTSLMPVLPEMKMGNIAETLLTASLTPAMATVATAYDQTGAAVATASPSVSGTFSLWGSGIWGTMVWGSASSNLQAGRISWSEPIVYQQLAIGLTGTCVAGAALGNLYIEVQPVNTALGTVS
jgi:hypothetical protein